MLHDETDPREQAAKNVATLAYVLYGLSLFVGVTALIAVIVNYVKKEDVAGTLAASHFRWQIRTFWFGLLWAVVGGILLLVLVGWMVLLANYIWCIYRIVKGWLRLNDGKAMYASPG